MSYYHRYPMLFKPPSEGSNIYQALVNLDYASGTSSGQVFFIHQDMFPAGSGIWSLAQSDGGDIRIFAADGSTRLPLEIITFNQGSEIFVAFTRLSSALAQNDDFIIQCGSDSGPLSQPAASAQYGSEEVWQDYIFVSHALVTDAAGNQTITNTGGAAQSAPNDLPARGYGSTYGAGTTDKSLTNYTTNATARTIQAYLFRHSTGGGTLGRVYDKGGALDQIFTRSTANQTYTQERGFSGGTGDWRGIAQVFDTWELLYLTYDASAASNDPIIYINGSPVTWSVDGNPTGTLSANANAMTIGNRADNVRVWDGIIGEFRIREAILGSSWIASESSNLITPGDFATVGDFNPV